MIAIFSAIGVREFYQMALPERKPESWLALCLGTSLIFLPLFQDNRLPLAAITILFVLFALIFLFRLNSIDKAAMEISYAILAFIYIPLLMMHLVLLRQTPFGVQWLFVIMLIVMTNDTAAYYTGSAFGKHRLYPQVSPKKSIEGALGGLCGSIAGTLLARATFFPQLSLMDALITAIVIGIVGQTGDLFESLLKRSFGVKDSGNCIPGHGGVLDRLDSIIFAAPVAYYYALYFFKG